MKNVITVLAFIISTQSFAGECKQLPLTEVIATNDHIVAVTEFLKKDLNYEQTPEVYTPKMEAIKVLYQELTEFLNCQNKFLIQKL